MPVLKQHFNTPALKEAIVLDLGDLGAQANKIKLAAEQRATQIINEAQARANHLAEQQGKKAYEEGLANGLEAGRQQGIEAGQAQALAEAQEKLQQVYAAWSDLAGQWEQHRIEMEREARQAVLDFALRATEKLVHRVLEVDDTVVVDQVGQALSLVLSAHDARLRIHPVDRPTLEAGLPELLAEFQNLKHVELVDDEEVTPGGCVVTFGDGRIDATIERQLERLIDLILPAPELTDDEEEAVADVEVASDQAVIDSEAAEDVPAGIDQDTLAEYDVSADAASPEMLDDTLPGDEETPLDPNA